MMITRRKEDELARLAAAEEASRLKDEFLATLSHELRTPLNAVLGWVQMLQAGDVSPDRLQKAIDVIGRNARLQAQLIEDILDVSRIITGKLEIERVPIVVPDLIEEVVAAALPSAKARGISLVRRLDADLPPIEGDPRRLQQALGNLLSNAVKFTPAGGEIAMTVTAADRAIEMRVRDTGSGIAPEFLPQVFDRFRQADSRTTRQHSGLGLGLAIARHLIEQHDGTIALQSDGEGRGTTATVRLPAASAADVATEGRQPLATPTADAMRLLGLTVLVVDDERDSREWLGTLFEEAGADVLTVGNAAGALEALDRSTVDLLVADIAMPNLDGYALIRQVRRTHQALPAIAVSAYARAQDRAEALASGYGGYCAKPVHVADLFQVVRDVMREAAPPAGGGELNGRTARDL
jgi:CheY-like chemotaxis protein